MRAVSTLLLFPPEVSIVGVHLLGLIILGHHGIKKTLLLLLFLLSEIFIVKFKTMKRQYRQLNQATKDKISRSATGRAKTQQHKERIKQSMLRYWSTIQDKPQDLTMDDYLGR